MNETYQQKINRFHPLSAESYLTFLSEALIKDLLWDEPVLRIIYSFRVYKSILSEEIDTNQN